MHKKLNSMKLINALSLSFERRQQDGAEEKNGSSFIYLFVFQLTWVFSQLI